jgi:hypothetical protein
LNTQAIGSLPCFVDASILKQLGLINFTLLSLENEEAMPWQEQKEGRAALELGGSDARRRQTESRAVDLGGGSKEVERSGILNNCGNNTI